MILMRSEKDLDQIIAATIKASVGETPERPAAFDILAQDEEEYLWLVARLKGKHGAKAIGVKRAFTIELARAM